MGGVSAAAVDEMRPDELCAGWKLMGDERRGRFDGKGDYLLLTLTSTGDTYQVLFRRCQKKPEI